MRIGILNCGGDCPGLNAVIHGVVGAAASRGWETIGFRDGFEGLLPPGDFTFLTPKDTEGILKQGGTILGTTNKGNFAAKIGEGDVARVPQEIVDRAKKTLDRLEVGALVVVGGDGSLTTAHQLYEMGWPIIGVPKTIDNDLKATSMTFGFDSAVSTVVEALDRLHTTAQSHKRVMVLEVMGRHAGWIALWGGMAGAANVILLPEIPFAYEKISWLRREPRILKEIWQRSMKIGVARFVSAESVSKCPARSVNLPARKPVALRWDTFREVERRRLSTEFWECVLG
jgi:6-phosphofructokinase